MLKIWIKFEPLWNRCRNSVKVVLVMFPVDVKSPVTSQLLHEETNNLPVRVVMSWCVLWCHRVCCDVTVGAVMSQCAHVSPDRTKRTVMKVRGAGGDAAAILWVCVCAHCPYDARTVRLCDGGAGSPGEGRRTVCQCVLVRRWWRPPRVCFHHLNAAEQRFYLIILWVFFSCNLNENLI